LCGAAEAITVAGGFYDVSLVGDAADERLTETSVRNHFCPFRKWKVGGQNHCGFFGAVGNDLEQVFGADLGDGDVADSSMARTS
jgi:hypothetical protein